jgi:hypothetical protein
MNYYTLAADAESAEIWLRIAWAGASNRDEEHARLVSFAMLTIEADAYWNPKIFGGVA